MADIAYGWSTKIDWLRPAFYQIWFYHEYAFVLAERLKNQRIIVAGWSDPIQCWLQLADLVPNGWYIADVADLVKYVLSAQVYR